MTINFKKENQNKDILRENKMHPDTTSGGV